jgi:methionine sulfoxide reductase catalytic subunit
MAGRYRNRLKWSDVTPEALWIDRRRLLMGSGALALGATAGRAAADTLEPSSWDEITSYNNFYEFGTGKDDPKRYAQALTTDPWSIEIDGLVERPGTYDLADLLSGQAIEERIYRFRCVEAWSMVIPWNGFELKDLLDRVGVRPSAQYVAFETILRPVEMPGVRYPVLEWPYREGLRIDEAMHPLTILSTGIYGREIPKQNGAPIRLVVPWKYGFKSIKSISRIRLTEEQPATSWNMSQPNEYGFYSNVNPEVDHPRWSQATERRIGGGLFAGREPTLMFNGYAEEVGGMYAGMDLSRFF